jgi:PKD repeat protein
MNHYIEHSDAVLDPTPSKQSSRKKLAGLVSFILVVGALVAINLSNTQTQGVSTYRNYSADAIIQGGAITEAELIQKYDQNASGVQSIFNHYGITRSDLTGKTSQIKHGTVYQDGRVVVDGKTVGTAAYSVSRKPFYDSKGNAPKTVTINGTTFYEGPNMSIFLQAVDAYVFFRDGQFYRAVLSSCSNPIVAKPVEVKKPQPVYSCDLLEREKINRTRFKFTATATAKNASVAHYVFDFGDGKSTTQVSSVAEHTYTQPGTYTVKVKVNISVDGKREYVTSRNCEVTVKVEEAPKVPVARCDGLTSRPIQGKDRTYAYTLRYTAENGANLESITYNFGDGTSETFSKENGVDVEHQYATPGAYTVTTTLAFKVTEAGTTTDKSESCTTSIVIPKPDNCPLPGKEDLPKNSPECVEPPVETPPELPQTGLGEWFAGAAGLATVAAAAYYWNMSRKHLIKTMLKK